MIGIPKPHRQTDWTDASIAW